MTIDEHKYNKLFLEKFKVKANELDSEFKRVISAYGNTEEVKKAFYSKLFETLITQFKEDLPKDQNYGYIISKLYSYFINALEADQIDNNKYKQELQHFKTTELSMVPKATNVGSTSFEPVYKNYNRNTKYGRRKAREQAALNYENGTPEYRKEIDNIRAVVWIIIFVIGIIVFLIKTSLK